MPSTTRVYDLFELPFGKVTCQSQAYDRYTKNAYQVAAKSIKQAYYLASNRVWFDGKVGLLAIKDGEGRWTYYDGSKHWDTRWKHYQVFKGV